MYKCQWSWSSLVQMMVWHLFAHEQTSNFDQNRKIIFQQNTFENVIFKVLAILFSMLVTQLIGFSKEYVCVWYVFPHPIVRSTSILQTNDISWINHISFSILGYICQILHKSKFDNVAMVKKNGSLNILVSNVFAYLCRVSEVRHLVQVLTHWGRVAHIYASVN